MTRRPYALVVSGDLEVAGTWMAWLRAGGHMTLGCAGPDRTDACPHAIGHLCPLRGVSDLTVVDATADPMGVCTGIGRQPTVRLGTTEPSTLDRRSFDERLRAAATVV